MHHRSWTTEMTFCRGLAAAGGARRELMNFWYSSPPLFAADDRKHQHIISPAKHAASRKGGKGGSEAQARVCGFTFRPHVQFAVRLSLLFSACVVWWWVWVSLMHRLCPELGKREREKITIEQKRDRRLWYLSGVIRNNAPVRIPLLRPLQPPWSKAD